jgi:hypothetical protein
MPIPGSVVGITVDRISLAATISHVMGMKNAALDASQEAFTKVTKDIKESSQLLVPRKTGDLQKSAYTRITRRFNDIDAEVGYDESNELGYAWIRHQVPAKTYTTPGTTHQYLILAFNQYEDVIADIVMKRFKKQLKKIGFKERTVGII